MALWSWFLLHVLLYHQRINRKPVADVLDEISSSPWNDFHGVEQHENIFGMEDEL